MARVTLLNPPFSLWDTADRKFRYLQTATPPLGLLQLTACVRAAGHLPALLDAVPDQWGVDQSARAVLATEPDYLVICAFTSTVVAANRVAAQVKAARPTCKVLVGGPHVTALPTRTLRDFPYFDYGGAGEGEEVLIDMLRELEAEGRLASPPQPGVILRDGEEVLFGGTAPLLKDLDDLPMPAWDLLPGGFERYRAPLFGYRAQPVGTMLTSRGCPYPCAFCDGAALGKKYRQQSAEWVREQAQHLIARFGVRHVIFYDDLFNLNRRRLYQVCDEFLRHGIKIGWNIDARVDTVDEESLARMKEAGCWLINYGIESGSQRILDAMKKQTTPQKVEKVVHLTKAAGIRSKGLFILGFPGETKETVAETASFVRRVPLDEMNLTIFTPYPGCEIYPIARELGSFDEDFEKMNGIRPVFVASGWTAEELDDAYGYLLRSFYRRPEIALNFVKMGWDSPSSVWRLVRSLPGVSRYGVIPTWTEQNAKSPS
ncbi:MAG: radical SAM protein [Candidatus Schekmanbacteria bacterium]|nr:radical SAM protein [Candidatus Schekmanbacteria bacterium]